MLFLRCRLEILSRILYQLDGASLLRCREVSRLFSKVIAEDLSIQYALELYFVSFMDRPFTLPDVCIRERLDMLRTFLRERRLRTTILDKHTKLPVFISEDTNTLLRHAYNSGLLVRNLTDDTVEIDDNGNAISRTLNIPRRDSGTEKFDCCIDCDKDMMIVSDIDQSGVYRFHILSLSTGSPHSLASQPHISWDDALGLPLDINAIGDVASVRDTIDSFAFNWKTGVTLVDLHGAEIDAFVLVNSDYYITEDEEEYELRVHEFSSSTVVLRLSLPLAKLDDEEDFECISITNGALRVPHHSSANRYHHDPFQTSPEDSVISLRTQFSSTHYLTVIPLSTLLDMVQSFASMETEAVLLPWGSWPQVTFELPADISTGTPASAYGHRVAIPASNHSSIKIFDFNRSWIEKGRMTRQVDLSSFTTVPPPPIQNIPITDTYVRRIFLDEDILLAVLFDGTKDEIHLFRV